MRQMRGDRQHLVVMSGAIVATRIPASFPHAVDLGERVGRGVRQRRQDAPAVAKQLGEPGFGAGMLGAGDRMARDEMHARRQMRAAVASIAAPLTEPTSVTIAPSRQRRSDAARRSRHRPKAASRSPRDRRPAAARAGSSVVSSANAEALDRRQRLGAAGAGDDMRLRAVAPQYPGQRRPDQPDPDQRDPIEPMRAHFAGP